MRATIEAIVIAALVLTTIVSAGEPPTFRKLHLGVPVEKQIPHCATDPEKAETTILPLDGACHDGWSVFFSDRFPLKIMNYRVRGEGRGLAALDAVFDFTLVTTIQSALSERYGHPSTTETPARTGAGIALKQHFTVWKTNGLVVTLVTPYSKTTDAYLLVESAAEHALSLKDAHKRTKSAADDL